MVLHIRNGNTWFLGAGVADVALADGRWLDPTGLVDNILAFWNMALGYLLRILPTAVLALDVVVVVGAGRRWQVGELAALGLVLLHHSGLLDRVLELLVLHLPFCLFLRLFEFRFCYRSFWWLGSM